MGTPAAQIEPREGRHPILDDDAQSQGEAEREDLDSEAGWVQPGRHQIPKMISRRAAAPREWVAGNRQCDHHRYERDTIR